MSETNAWAKAMESELDELLRRADALTPDDLWRVAVLLGRVAQLPATPVELAELADRAARTGLGGVALAEASRPTAGDVLDALEAALFQQDDPAGPLADALLDVDDLLTVLSMEGRQAEADAIAAQAAALVDLAPGGPVALDAWAARRLATVAEDAPAGSLWGAVAAASANTVLSALPARRIAGAQIEAILDRAGAPKPRLHLPRTTGRVPAVRERIVTRQDRGPAAPRAWSNRQLASFEVRRRAPVMGHAEQPEMPWVLVGRVTPSGRWFRVFVVDEEYPDGYDVTDLVETPGTEIWHLEHPGQEAHIVLVTASTPVPGASLAEVLDAAEQREDAVAVLRRLTRPR